MAVAKIQVDTTRAIIDRALIERLNPPPPSLPPSLLLTSSWAPHTSRALERAVPDLRADISSVLATGRVNRIRQQHPINGLEMMTYELQRDWLDYSTSCRITKSYLSIVDREEDMMGLPWNIGLSY